jgi:hypothetical protein
VDRCSARAAEDRGEWLSRTSTQADWLWVRNANKRA